MLSLWLLCRFRCKMVIIMSKYKHIIMSKYKYILEKYTKTTSPRLL